MADHAGQRGGAPAAAVHPSWLRTDVASRAQAEAVLKAQQQRGLDPASPPTMLFLVRPRAGKERSFALSALTPNGGQINQLLEQQPGGTFVTAGGKAVGDARMLAEAVPVLLAQLCETHGCRAVGADADGQDRQHSDC